LNSIAHSAFTAFLPTPLENPAALSYNQNKERGDSMDGVNNLAESTEQEINRDKVYWHDAHFAAIQLELHDYNDDLIFEETHPLSEEALEIDIRIIKKARNIKITKNIGKIFKLHNIVEVKSEKDNLLIWDYNKVAGGYAMLYSAFGKVSLKDISVTFVVTQKPVKLFNHLKKERCFTVEEVDRGIYCIVGDAFPIQVIENKRLAKEDNFFLKNLRSTLTRRDIIEVINIQEKYGMAEKVNIYLNRVLDANKSVFEEVLAMGGAAVREILDNHIMTNGVPSHVEARIEENTKRDTAIEMLKDGFSPDKIARYVQQPLEWVQNLIRQ
jgi:hypothetical protein